MSNSESIIVGQTKTSTWRKSDTTWTLGLFGTAIGAGVLFFPIRALRNPLSHRRCGS